MTWTQVYVQLGSHPDKHGDKVTVQAFRKKCLRELKKITLAWPGLDYTIEPGRLILRPTAPQIPTEKELCAYA